MCTQVLAYNMVGTFIQYINILHTNENVAIGLFKETMLKILLEPEEKKPKTWRTTGRNGALCTSHKELPGCSNKYKNNQKSSFKMPILRLKREIMGI